MRAYVCGTDLRHELETPDMLGDCKIAPNAEYAMREWPCADECGLAEVEVTFVRWVREPKI